MSTAFSFSAPRFTEEDEMRELAAMTDAERKEVEEDLYGTHAEPEETDELLQQSLQEFERALNAIPNKEAYLQACQTCPQLVQTESAPIRFLRSEKYQAEKAAKRLVTYWQTRCTIFADRAFLPMKLEGGALGSDDVATLKWGHTEILPHDKHGRLVLCHDRSNFNLQEMNHPSVVKCIWYIIHVALENEEYCRRGLVVVIPSHNTVPQHFSRKYIKIFWGSVRDALPVPLRAIHACHPTVVTDLMFPVIKQVMGMELRRRWYRHCGPKSDVLRTLAEYGLEAQHLPTVLGGSWVRNPEWIEKRKLLEKSRDAEQEGAAQEEEEEGLTPKKRKVPSD